MKVTDLLLEQHRIVADLFGRIEGSTDKAEKRELFKMLARTLSAHEEIERELFYPACKKIMGISGMVGEAVAEHGVVRFCLYLANEVLGRDDFDFRLAMLKEIVERHVKEEESDFFPSVESTLDSGLQEELAALMQARFEDAYAMDYPRSRALRPTFGKTAIVVS